MAIINVVKTPDPRTNTFNRIIAVSSGSTFPKVGCSFVVVFRWAFCLFVVVFISSLIFFS